MENECEGFEAELQRGDLGGDRQWPLQIKRIMHLILLAILNPCEFRKIIDLFIFKLKFR